MELLGDAVQLIQVNPAEDPGAVVGVLVTGRIDVSTLHLDALVSTRSAAGCNGNPGIVRISPHNG